MKDNSSAETRGARGSAWRVIRKGSVAVKVYRNRHPSNRSGWSYVVAWHTPEGRARQKFADEQAAIDEATLKAMQITAGKVDATAMSATDRDELAAARKLAGNIPVLSALDEWRTVRRLCGGSLLAAAEAWAKANGTKLVSITVAQAVEKFIAAKNKGGAEGDRTYKSKLAPLVQEFGADTPLAAIGARRCDQYLARFENPTTRNDYRKRAVSLWRWAQAKGYLAHGVPLAMEQTERAKEKPPSIGILTPEQFSNVLEFVRAKYPEHLAAVVLAGFCGIRSDEIHGKRSAKDKENRKRRQLWEHVRIQDRRVYVSAAKENTPNHREVPLCDSAVKWLMLCERRGDTVCEPAALEKLRVILKKKKFPLPENCFRHSFITYRVAVTQSKPQVALEAGNSVSQIDRHYRIPVSPELGAAWFAIVPKEKGEVIPMKEVRRA